MTLSSTTSQFDTAAADLVAAAAAVGADASNVDQFVAEPGAAFAARQVLADQALSHNAATVTALVAAVRELRSRS